jgi:hypothetical protein
VRLIDRAQQGRAVAQRDHGHLGEGRVVSLITECVVHG